MSFLFSILAAGAVAGAAAANSGIQQTFEARLPEIVASNQCLNVDGATFVTVKIDSNDNDFRSVILERKTIDLIAESCVRKNKNASGLAPELESMLTREYLLVTRYFETLAPYAVKSERLLDGSICVWGIPEKTFGAGLPSWQTVRKGLCNPVFFSEPDFLPLSVMEIASPELQLELRKEFVRRLQFRYGAGCALLCSGGLLVSYSPGLARTLTRDFLRDSANNQLLETLNILPGDPRVLASLATRLDGRGMHIAAQWLASRGGLAFIDYAASQACAAIVAKGTMFKMTEYPCDIDLKVFEKMLAKVDFSGTPVEIFSQWRRPFPGGLPSEPDAVDADYAEGLRCFTARQPDLPRAYDAFLRSIARNISFYACDYAGVCALEASHYDEAVLLLLQAAATRPTDHQDWPWTNLARIAKRLKDSVAFAYCVERLKTCTLSPWSREKMKEECGLELP